MVLTPRALSDAAFLEGAQRGDVPAARHLIESYQQPALAFATYLTGTDRDRAYEVTSASFVDGIRAECTMGQPEPFLLVVLRIVLAKCREKLPGPSGNLPEIAASSPERSVMLRWVQQGLLALPLDARVPLLLRDQLTLSYEEIARVLGVPTTAVKSQVIQARVQLRNHVKRALEHPGS